MNTWNDLPGDIFYNINIVVTELVALRPWGVPTNFHPPRNIIKAVTVEGLLFFYFIDVEYN